MRGSDPDAALYWLAKMIHAGEDPRFIARRIVICAAEDVGLADPMALVLANAALAAAEFVGWPEARIPLAEATIYIATANKSNSAIVAIDAALEDVRSGRTIPVPEHLRDATTKARNASATARATNTPTTARIISWRRIIWAWTRFFTSRPNKAWKGKSRSGWRTGGNSSKNPRKNLSFDLCCTLFQEWVPTGECFHLRGQAFRTLSPMTGCCTQANKHWQKWQKQSATQQEFSMETR